MAEAYVAAATVATNSFVNDLLIYIPVLLLFAVLIWVWYKVAKNMAIIAADKGYTEKKWFHYCFWLGIVGILMVCAMPDKTLHNQRDALKGPL